MERKIFAALCCVLLLWTLTGCQLAKESAGTNAQTQDDRLIGVFITTEHLDLFDFESYLSDNLKSFQGGEISANGNSQKYQGRLYAVLAPRTLKNEETGETSVTHEYVFEGIEGISYFAPTIPSAADENSYVSSMSDAVISDGHMSLNYSDDEKTMSLEATIYVTSLGSNRTFHFNPVYQCADGDVYALTGDAFRFDYDTYSEEGVVFSQTLDAAVTTTENGVTKSDSSSVKTSISIMFAPERVAILEMDPDSMILSRTEYDPGAMPETIELDTSTAYIIVETHKRSGSGPVYVSREIYDADAENIETFYARPDGICVKHWMRVI